MSITDEQLRIAEQAAEWLVRLDTAGPQQLEEFWNWLAQSPVHVKEMLLAQACHAELTRTLKKSRIKASRLALSARQGNIDGKDAPGVDALVTALSVEELLQRAF